MLAWILPETRMSQTFTAKVIENPPITELMTACSPSLSLLPVTKALTMI